MKINFTAETKYVPEFNDNHKLPEAEQLRTVCSVIEIAEYFHILDVLQQIGFTSGDQKSLNLSQMATLAKEAGPYVTKYVKFEGNENFSASDVVKFPAFFPLVTELLFKLVEIASPKGQDVKN